MYKWIARPFKVYTKEEVLKPFINRPYKNLFEMANSLKSQGVGVKFWRKTWPENSYYTITRIEYENIRNGRAWGILTWKGETATKEESIRSALKLGTWKHSSEKNA
jgi:Mitochondrial 28S ribosomal protein S34